jgi:hypothetical protein
MFFVAPALLTLLAGCSTKYQHSDLSTDSPEGKKVAAMIEAVRKAKSDGLNSVILSNCAPGLNDREKESLKATLAEISAASGAELAAIDRFGDNVFRASIRLAGPQESTIYVLLISKDDQLYWAGRN